MYFILFALTQVAIATSTDNSPGPCILHPTPGSYPVDVTMHCDDGGYGTGCITGQVLKIVHAEFGRRDDIYYDEELQDVVCPIQPILQSVCTHPDALSLLKKMCDGLSYCGIGHGSLPMASPAYFWPDPCPGSSKYLTTKYECCPVHCGDDVTVTVCEGRKEKLKCPRNYEIRILSARYGRGENDSTCFCGSDVTYPQCHHPDSWSRTLMNCDKQRRCVVKAETSPFVFWPDNCPLTPKYLTVKYKCCQVPEPPLTCTRIFDDTICQDDSKLLECKAGKLLYILDAWYGRFDEYTCDTGPILTTSCHDPYSTITVRASCNQQPSCTVTASSTFFTNSDPCPGTTKRLRVKYRCC